MQVNRGDSFMLPLQVSVDGLPQDCTNWKVFSSYGTDTERLGDFEVIWQDRAAGSFFLSASTAAWPLGKMSLDITYVTDADQEITTQRVRFEVLRRITPIPLPSAAP